MNISDTNTITYRTTVEGIDWEAFRTLMIADDWDNERTPYQYQLSFENSYSVCIVYADDAIIGTARAISDGVCNAYIVDVWTHSAYRHRGIGTQMMRTLMQPLEGQHVYLHTGADTVPFYTQMGFEPQGPGVSLVVGKWLHNETRKD